MKKLVEEVENEGLISLMGKRITLFCANYIYTGKLTGVNDDCVRLDEAALVFETGDFGSSSWKDAQPLPSPWYVVTGAVESYGVMK